MTVYDGANGRASGGAKHLLQFRCRPAQFQKVGQLAVEAGLVSLEGEPNRSAMLRQLIEQASAVRQQAAPAEDAHRPPPAAPSAPCSDTALPPPDPVLAAALKATFSQVQGARTNLNQLVRDWHLMRQGLAGRSGAPVTPPRIERILGDLERDVVEPLRHLLAAAGPLADSVAGTAAPGRGRDRGRRPEAAGSSERSLSSAERFGARRMPDGDPPPPRTRRR